MDNNNRSSKLIRAWKEGGCRRGVVAQWQSTGGSSQRPWVRFPAAPLFLSSPCRFKGLRTVAAPIVSLIDTITIGLRTTEESCPSDSSIAVITLSNSHIDDIIASVQPTESTPPTLQENEFDNDIDNCSKEFMPSADEAQKAAQILRAYFSSKENVETSLLHKLSDNDRTLAYTIATSKTQGKLTDSSPQFNFYLV